MRGVEQAAAGDARAAFTEMYRTALPVVYGFVSLRVGGDKTVAEDITAETFTAALKHFQAGQGKEINKAWLRMVAKRRLVDYWRRQAVASDKVVVLAAGLRNHSDPSVEERDRVLAALARLSEQHRAALVMQQVEGYSVTEIASILGRSDKAIESLLTRARDAFRTAYREENDD